MLSHNLKIALRNLAKYKLQTLISVLSIAIGIVALAAVHNLLSLHFRLPQITTTSHYERACRLTLDSLNRDSLLKPDRTVWVSLDVLRAIKNGGELYGVELGPTYPNGRHSAGECHFIQGDTLERKIYTMFTLIDPLYPNYAGYVSAITGKPIAPLRNGEAILSESKAWQIFGDVNPIGASLKGSYMGREQNLIVSDVYQELGQFDGPPDISAILFSRNNEEIMAVYHDGGQSVPWLDCVLKPECTPEQLAAEVNRRIAPLGLKVKARWVKDALAGEMFVISTVRTVVYFLGSLILLAAIVGYLRMQMQLFWMRKRELSLRIVNGAKRRQLFVLLMTEVALVLLLAVGLAIFFGTWLEEFVNAVSLSMQRMDALQVLHNLIPDSVAVGAVLLLICGVMVWMTLGRIAKSSQGLAANMRAARSHGFRNTMLWLQITVGMFFVSAALLTASFCELVANEQVLPDDFTPYENATVLNVYHAEHGAQLLEELGSLPEVAQMFPYSKSYCLFGEIAQKDSLWQPRWGSAYKEYLAVTDAAALDFFNAEVAWTRPELKNNERCVLVQEDMYALLKSEDVLTNGILTVQHNGVAYPVAGTFKDVVFSRRIEQSRTNFIVVDPIEDKNMWHYDYLLLPKDNDAEALRQAADITIKRIEQGAMHRFISGFVEEHAPQVILTNNMRKAGWILGAVALVICVMGIYSTIALDTRARRKEVAIRKINGAKPKDIALLFARLYVVLITITLALLLPLATILQYIVHTINNDNGKESIKDMPVLLLVLIGCLVVILAIALIVGWQVRSIMRVNPAEMVAKE